MKCFFILQLFSVLVSLSVAFNGLSIFQFMHKMHEIEERTKTIQDNSEYIRGRTPSLEAMLNNNQLAAAADGLDISPHCKSDYQLMMLAFNNYLHNQSTPGLDNSFILTLTGGTNSSVCHVACLDPDTNTLSWRGVLIVVILFIVLAIVLLGTAIDYFWYQGNKNHHLAKAVPVRIFLAFSFYTNTVEIFAAKNRPGTIEAVHCIRCFSMFWVIAGHVFGLSIDFSNNVFDALPIMKDFMSQVITNAFFSVDSFFFLSGLLLGFMWFKELKKNRKAVMSPTAWIMFYVHRIIRLSPPYFMVLAFYAWVFPYFLNQAPMFTGASPYLIGSCPQNWWINFIYLSNIIDYKNQCYPASWYLSTDMQIHLFAPIVLIPLAISPLLGVIVSGLLFFLSTASSIFTIYYFHMDPTDMPSPFAFKDPEYTVDPQAYTFYIYDAPWVRFPVYMMGLLLGYYLQMNKKKVVISKPVNVIGWALSFALMLTAVFGLYSYFRGEEMTVFWRAMYTAFSRPVWGLGLCWIVYSSYYGYGGPFNRFLSWNIWIPLGRLTYCSYLVHMFVALYVMGTAYGPFHWSGVIDIFIHQILPCIILSYFVAIIWSAAFEIATTKIEMIFLGNLRKRPHREEIASGTDASKNESTPNGILVSHVGDDTKKI